MNKLQVKGNWNVAKGKVKQGYANVTEDPYRHEEGQADELVGRTQERIGRAKANLGKALRKRHP
ncbi:MAG TPA: CsbD family protein [Verrucomicrobiae bacterium]